MPYIDEADRHELDTFSDRHPESAGELNYALTMVALDYLERNGLSYATCADIVSSFDNAKDEFRRRVQHPYEDRKRAINGDVYPGA